MDYIEFSGKTVEDAITEALIKLETTREKLDYNVIDKGSNGILGFIGSKPAKIEARKVFTLEDKALEFLGDMFDAMNMEVDVKIEFNEEDSYMNIELSGDEMGIVIGKRGQTIDSIQYLVSLVVNKESDTFIRVKVDTENYRQRRRETLENLAKNISYKVKRTRKPVSLEPMNPYERRIIHSALQNDKYVYTKSEGEEPYRHVIVCLKRQ